MKDGNGAWAGRQRGEPPGEEARYKALGFMCGLEIHQRLATERKLFCACPASPPVGSDKVIGTIYRYQRAVAGELGDVDRSAEFEELRNRKFVYQTHDKHTCLVEVDEEPPHEVNEEALKLSLSFAKAFGMKPVDEMQPMRKEVVDGSDPSAFQRTILVAMDGKINVDGHAITMPTIFLEEESCGIVSGHEDEITDDVERLGIPLVEVDTDPHIPTPKAAKAVALYIGSVLRVSGRVQRGIGSIRQDVNVSIRGGARVEIKGLQEIDKVDKFIENEVARQQKLIELKEKLVKSGAEVGKPEDVSAIFKNGAVKIITGHLEKGGIALAFGLKGFKGVLGAEVNPQRRFGTEISDYAKMAKVNGIIHSDENLPGYGFSDEEMARLRERVGHGYDSFILVAGSRENAHRAVQLAIGRAKYALVGVPLETRGVGNVELATTKFLRPLPSGSRMYPETDVRPILVSKELAAWAEKNAPDIESEKKALSAALQNGDIVEQLVLSPKLAVYKSIVGSTSADPNFVANVLLQKMTELRRAGLDVDSIEEKGLMDIFSAYGRSEVTKQAVEELLKEASKSKDSVQSIIKHKGLKRVSGRELDALVKEAMKGAGGDADQNALRSAIMTRYRLTVDGAELNGILSGLFKKAR